MKIAKFDLWRMIESTTTYFAKSASCHICFDCSKWLKSFESSNYSGHCHGAEKRKKKVFEMISHKFHCKRAFLYQLSLLIHFDWIFRASHVLKQVLMRILSFYFITRNWTFLNTICIWKSWTIFNATEDFRRQFFLVFSQFLVSKNSCTYSKPSSLCFYAVLLYVYVNSDWFTSNQLSPMVAKKNL